MMVSQNSDSKDKLLGQGPQHISYTVAIFSEAQERERDTPNNTSSARALASAAFSQANPISVILGCALEMCPQMAVFR